MKALVRTLAFVFSLTICVLPQQKISDTKKTIDPKAIEYFDLGADCEEADVYCQVSNYTKAIKIDPTFADAYYGRSNLYDGAEKTEGALHDLTEAIRFYGEAAAHPPSERVRSWFENGRYGEASALNPKIREIDEYLADAYYVRSRVYAEAGDMAKANADLDEARRIDPTVVQRNH